MVLGCPERSPFRVIVDPIVAMVAISAASWKEALGYSVGPFHGQELASAPKALH
jgi:hypothetical protein